MARDSNNNPAMPGAATPLNVYGLNLSKLVRRSGLAKVSVPP